MILCTGTIEFDAGLGSRKNARELDLHQGTDSQSAPSEYCGATRCIFHSGKKREKDSDANEFTENVFARNLHPIETGALDVSGSAWAVNGVGNFWGADVELDLDRDGIIDLPHRELDLFGVLRRDFPVIAFLSDSPALKLLRFANQRAL